MSGPLVLPYEAWPLADREMWQKLFRQGSLLDEAGAMAHVRATTRASCEHQYGRWLAWLQNNEPSALDTTPAGRATPERLQRWLDDLSGLAPTSQETYFNGVVWILKSAAPEDDWRRHSRALAVLRTRTRQAPQSTRKTGRILDSRVLFEAGVHLATDGADRAETPLKAAKARRDGAMVALLALMPIRRRSFATLALGQSFLVKDGGFHIQLSEEMTKTGQWWEAPVPASVEPVLRRYLNEVRPWFLSRGRKRHETLWVDNRGASYALGYLGHRIKTITEKTVGVRVSPHLFRDAAATTLCRASPKDAQLARALLGHASFETTERHYIHAQGIETGRDYAAVLAGITGGGSER